MDKKDFAHNEMKCMSDGVLKQKNVKSKWRRDSLKIKTKLYSDSTRRFADVLRLRSEILCLSGDGLGQIVQTELMTQIRMKRWFFWGGANDQNIDNFPSTDL